MFSTLFANSFLSVALLLTPPSITDAKATTIKYRYFDEFLIHLNKGEQALIIGEEVEGSGEIEAVKSVKFTFNKPHHVRSGMLYNWDAPCCDLGQLAGEKGYLCNSRFYVARLINRNYNRAHNRRIESLRDGSPVRGSAEKLMRTFGQCVSRGSIFHKCCQLATLENGPDRYDTYKKRLYKNHGNKNTKSSAKSSLKS